jgi:hypothetical protein
MKRLKIILLLILVLIIVVVVTVPLWIDGAARSVIESEGSKALGVELTLKELHLSLFGGEAKLGDMKIANPEGYTDDQFFGLGAGHASVSYGSGEEEEEETTEGKKFVIKKVSVRNITVTSRMRALVVKPALTAKIDEITLTDVGSGSGVPMGEIIRKFIGGLLAGIANSGIELAGDIGKGLGNATLSIGKDGIKVVGEGGKAVTDVVEGIGGLIPGKKKKK